MASPFLAKRNIRYLPVILVVLGSLATAVLWRAAPPHGLLAAHYAQPNFTDLRHERVETVAMLSRNDITIDQQQLAATRWVGFLWITRARTYTFVIPADLYSQLQIGGQQVFDTDGTAPAVPGAASATLQPGLHPIEFSVVRPPGTDGPFNSALAWQTPLGWRAVPSYRLYPEAPSEDDLVSERRRQLAAGIAVSLVAVSLVGLITSAMWKRRRWWRTREAWMLTALVGIAFAFRLIYLADAMRGLPNYYDLPEGSDNGVYEIYARDFARGLYPSPKVAFNIQPGFPLFVGAIYRLIWPSVQTYQYVQLALGALTAATLYLIGKHIFDAAVGWVAGGLWSAFSLAIFYDAQILTHALEAHLGAAIIGLWLLALTTHKWQWLSALGFTIGLAALVRPSFLTLVPFVVLSLFLQNRGFFAPPPAPPHRKSADGEGRHGWGTPSPQRRKGSAQTGRSPRRCGEGRGGAKHRIKLSRWAALGRSLIFTAVVLAPILPITFHNYRASQHFQLISGNAPITLYLGNNRDTSGLGEYSPALEATRQLVNMGQTTFVRQTLDDIRANPLRWLQLIVRKLALYLGNAELPNNVDFYSEGAGVSPLLRLLPLRFGGLMALGMAGAALAVYREREFRPGLWIILVYALVQIVTTVAFHVVSRFRVGIYPALCLLAAYALTTLVRQARQRDVRRLTKSVGLVLASIALIASMLWIAEHVMARPIVAEVPATAVRIDRQFGNGLTLLGYEPLPAVLREEPLFVTLYWQASAPLPSDYYATLQVFESSGRKVTQTDIALGTGSFPDYPASRWRPGQIIWDRYLLATPGDLTVPQALDLMVAVYERGSGDRLQSTDGADLINLGTLVVKSDALTTLPDTLQGESYSVGPFILLGYEISPAGDALEVALYWTTEAEPAPDAVVFVHLWDEAGNFLMGQDSKPSGGQYPTFVWSSGEVVRDLHVIPLPPDAATEPLQIRIGMYDPATQNRFEVTSADGQPQPDNIIPLAELDVLPAPE